MYNNLILFQFPSLDERFAIYDPKSRSMAAKPEWSSEPQVQVVDTIVVWVV
jgi:hypothetical protein